MRRRRKEERGDMEEMGNKDEKATVRWCEPHTLPCLCTFICRRRISLAVTTRVVQGWCASHTLPHFSVCLPPHSVNCLPRVIFYPFHCFLGIFHCLPRVIFLLFHSLPKLYFIDILLFYCGTWLCNIFDGLNMAFSMFLHLVSYYIMASNWKLCKNRGHTLYKQAH